MRDPSRRCLRFGACHFLKVADVVVVAGVTDTLAGFIHTSGSLVTQNAIGRRVMARDVTAQDVVSIVTSTDAYTAGHLAGQLIASRSCCLF